LIAVELLQRAAAKSPRYLVKRGIRELNRLAGSRRLRGRLATLSAADVIASTGRDTLASLWRSSPAAMLGPSPREAEELRALYVGLYAPEAAALRERADRILQHEVDLLGSGLVPLGPEIDWHLDFKSGRRWPLSAHRIDYSELDRSSDVKIPWELSRCQHLTTLGRAWVIFGEERLAREFESQIRSWIRSNPVGRGVNWACTMDVALRAVSWTWALALFSHAPLSAAFLEELLLSLYRHGAWISQNLEDSDVNGNHYVSDLLGLLACGAAFAGTSAGEEWLRTGADALEREIRRQVGDDGVDVEGSVSYHRLVLEIFLVAARLLDVVGRPPTAEYRRRLESMLDFVCAYVTPKGSSPAIGDADDGRALVLGESDVRDHRYLLAIGAVHHRRPDWKRRAEKPWQDALWLLGPSAYAEFQSLRAPEEEEAPSAFPVAGFYVLRSRRQYLFVDAGPVGFYGRGGHGHNDCLSFEWHAFGRPVLTDSGSFVYTASVDWRNRFRSTAFHNTIRVDGEEINRFVSPLALWDLRDDARPFGVELSGVAGRQVLRAAHTGYRRLRDPVTVQRRFEVDPRDADLRIVDRLEGAASHRVEFFFHGATGGSDEQGADGSVRFVWPAGFKVTIAQQTGPAVAWRAEDGWFSPSYGIKQLRRVWIATLQARLPIEITWKLTAARGAADANGDRG
jgi:hypothetical protein